MADYLVTASYSPEGVKGVLKSGGTAREDAVNKAGQGLGGKMHSFHFPFGGRGGVRVVDSTVDLHRAVCFTPLAVASWCSPAPTRSLRVRAGGFVGVRVVGGVGRVVDAVAKERRAGESQSTEQDSDNDVPAHDQRHRQ